MNLEFTFIVINLDDNLQGLIQTKNSIRSNFSQDIINIVNHKINADDFEKMNKICESFKCKNEISIKCDETDKVPEFINTGLKNIKTEWGFFLVAGSHIFPSVFRKIQFFLKSPKDIMYPVLDKKRIYFDQASINGLFVNKKAIKDVGEMPTDMWKENTSMLTLSKRFWQQEAIQKGYTFKGIVGMRIC